MNYGSVEFRDDKSWKAKRKSNKIYATSGGKKTPAVHPIAIIELTVFSLDPARGTDLI